ncbi:hypothetical protein [Aeromicrobium endophyticum]|uniref:Uncharacterized protein n=1 Tax=Aeromicrobium endophyticum TaxID=2292704 RepID=A0A371PDT6_9ACTN|nr:hypothetical protein [Aeromicrobium endophyticum]REK73580.1 hypothetical protein DX116_08565 [Aeromicrobium endophyticum]
MTTGGHAAQRWQSWILEGVAACGGSASPIDVSRQVWSRHRAEIEALGDLLYVWQLELRDAADAMIATGLLASDDDGWTVADGEAARAVAARPAGWSDDEIAVAVEAYVSLLRDRDAARPLRRQEAAARVREHTGRTSVAVDAMFANISAVVQEMGVEFLTAYAPRSNVPRGVRPAVEDALRP